MPGEVRQQCHGVVSKKQIPLVQLHEWVFAGYNDQCMFCSCPRSHRPYLYRIRMEVVSVLNPHVRSLRRKAQTLNILNSWYIIYTP